MVIWHIHPGSGVWSVTGITMKSSLPSTNIFVPNDPQPLGGGIGENWNGEISPTTRVGSEYNYDITWSGSNGASHVFDPMIKINS
jgi:hypothetical protein